MRFYVDYNEKVAHRYKYNLWLDEVRNYNGEFYTMQMLKSTKALKNEVNPHLDNVEYPRELQGIIRFKTNDGQEVIKTVENFGIDSKLMDKRKG